jgi:hypothetical protein
MFDPESVALHGSGSITRTSSFIIIFPLANLGLLGSLALKNYCMNC